MKALDGYSTIAGLDFPWEFGIQFNLCLKVTHLYNEESADGGPSTGNAGTRIEASVDGNWLFDVTDTDRPLSRGAIALVIEEGRLGVGAVRVERAT